MLSLKNVSRKVKNTWLLRDITIDIPFGDIFIIHGPSGSGKTSLLRVINGLDPITTGSISSNGKILDIKNIWEWRREHPLVFQDARLFPGTIEDNIRIPAEYHGMGVDAEDLLAKVDLKKDLTTDVSTLSGGEQQKLAIARALALNPKVLLLDEPTSNLDHEAKILIERVLLELCRKQQVSIILVTHDQQQVKRLGNHGAVLKEGRIVKKGTIIENSGERTRDY